MLDNATKRRIDNARQILVGKVPDPKAQVEQITTALIYKFMDDMDQESVELGGKATFFTGDYAQFSWGRLMDKRLGGAQRLDLYVRAITQMSENPHLPQLFRTIFKGTFLPYRDFETLNLFLKEINSFTYDHSERLGDAFEYLLSVLGSQGKVGQFRTPRHIIDFIVEIVAPSKRETVLDPACGTAGFLISAYKHILKKNAATPLTPAERERLTSNFVGYDISPDMVRLSLVNMYLHQFPSPTIVEYDTLTSDARWDDGFDVILANPPFMTPKGGIRPHNRFSIQASRSELLFVDYIAEHLHKNGRAGIIVPEGIIFQSGKAYKKLRKMLVEDGFLVAVVSLPAGVFQPYSGVKTSILLLDKRLAKGTDDLLFVNIGHDGFGTGAQRRPTTENDLPAALRLLRHFQADPRAALEPSAMAHKVAKSTIAADGDYNFSGGRYREAMDYSNVQWPLVSLGDVFTKITNSIDPKQHTGNITYIGLENIESHTGSIIGKYKTEISTIKSNKSRFEQGDILYGKLRPNLNKVYLATDSGICSTDIFVLRGDENVVIPNFYVPFFRSKQFNTEVLKGLSGAQLPRVGWKYFASIKIPLPPLAVQEAIVAEIEGYQQVVDGARQVLAHYKPHIVVDPEWTAVALGEVLDFVSSGATPKGGKSVYQREGVLFIRSQNILVGSYDFSNAAYISHEIHQDMKRSHVKKGDVFLNITGASIGRSAYMDLDMEANVNQHVALLRTNETLSPSYLSLFLNSSNGQEQIFGMQSGASREALNYSQIRKIEIPLPPIETQRAIVATIEAEQALVAGNKQLAVLFEAKIAVAIARVWGA